MAPTFSEISKVKTEFLYFNVLSLVVLSGADQGISRRGSGFSKKNEIFLDFILGLLK